MSKQPANPQIASHLLLDFDFFAVEAVEGEVVARHQVDQPLGLGPLVGQVDRQIVQTDAALDAEDRFGVEVAVQGGGCSGLSYNVRFDTQPRERDRIFQFNDIRVFVDPKSFIYLNGMTLDYQETLMQQGFVFVNPQATKSCGCGTSFSA